MNANEDATTMKRAYRTGTGKAPPNLDAIIDEATGAHHGDMYRARPYDGQPHTDTGERGKTEIKGITFRDLRDCFIRAIALSAPPGGLYKEGNKGEQAYITENEIHGLDMNDFDMIAVQQNLACEVERLMGIYPNVPKLRER